MRSYSFLLLSFALLIGPVQSFAADLTSPQGFSLTYPDDWKAASKEEIAKVEAAVKQEGAVASYAAIVTGPVSDGFATNVNVVVKPGSIELNADTEKVITASMSQALAQAGIKAELKVGHATVDGKKALTIAFARNDPKVGKDIRQWTVFVPGKKQFYVATCTALKSRWKNDYPALDGIVQSMKIDLEEGAAKGDAKEKEGGGAEK